MIVGDVSLQPNYHPLKVVIVGAGTMGRFHADAAHRAGGTIVAVIDCNKSAADALARRFPGSVASSRLGDLLLNTRPDIVHICTPDMTHSTLAFEVAAAGAHALIEKPLAPNVEEVQNVLTRFAAASSFVVPAHQYAFQPVIEKIVANLGTLGQLRRIQFDIRSAGADNDMARFDEVAKTILPHPLALLQRFLPAVDVGLIPWTVSKASAGEFLVTAVADNIILAIAISMNGRPTRFSTSLLGDCGSIEIDNFNGYSFGSPALSTRFYKISAPFRNAASQFSSASVGLAARLAQREYGYVGLRSLVRAFQVAVRSGNADDLPITPSQIRANAIACTIIGGQADWATHG